MRKAYSTHWCDTFGAQYASVGHGKKSGHSIGFLFNHTDGPFHNKFTWDPSSATWTFLMEAEEKDGKRKFFAEDTVRRK